MRLTFSQVTPDEIDQGVRRLAKAVANLRRIKRKS